MKAIVDRPTDLATPTKLRVLHILAALRSGGVDMLLYNYFMHMDHSRIAFDFIVHHADHGMAEQLMENEDVRVYHLPRFRKVFANFFKTRRIIKRGHYTIVHVHHTCQSFVQLLAAWSCGVEVRIAHSHDCVLQRGFKKWLFRFYGWLTTKLATDYFACGNKAGRYVFGNRVASERYHFLHNAICLDKFAFDCKKREAIRKKYGLCDNHFVLLCVGRFAWQKNHERLVEIFAKVQERNAMARLLLVGEGGGECRIRSLVKERGLDEKVRFVGKTSDVASFLHAADVFVLPSFHEGFPVVLVEAQAAGLPCVVSTAVTEEANLAGHVRYLPLEASNDAWAEAVCSARVPNRTQAPELLRRAGYDLSTEAPKLQKWYFSKAESKSLSEDRESPERNGRHSHPSDGSDLSQNKE